MTPKLFFITLVLSLFLPGCDRKKESIVEKTVVEQETKAKYNEQTALKFLAAMRENVLIDSTKSVTIKDWPAQALITNTITDLTGKPISKRTEMALTLRQHLDDFKNTIPNYLQVDNIQDAIEDLEKQVTVFETQLPKKHIDAIAKNQHVVNIVDAMQYLNSKILQTYHYYGTNPSPEVYAYLTELNDYSVHKTTAQELRAAAFEKQSEANLN